MPSYFLLSLSNRTNLDLCLKHALAGFTNSANGFWTYLEVEEGDFVSFLYGAKAWNLYKVRRKVALRNAEAAPPWPPVTFQQSGKTYYFPFRLELEPVRFMRESLVRHEFAYVAENLLLRGGYRKTHFQADQTTLQEVSQLGSVFIDTVQPLTGAFQPFTPLVTFAGSRAEPPSTYPFSELIVQTLVKKYLRQDDNLKRLLSDVGLGNLAGQRLEVLGERALPEGQVDILLKEATPFGTSNMIAVEVKLRNATLRDVEQLARYMGSLGSECKAGILIAEKASTRVVAHARTKGVHILVYSLALPPGQSAFSFSELVPRFSLRAA